MVIHGWVLTVGQLSASMFSLCLCHRILILGSPVHMAVAGQRGSSKNGKNLS